MPVRIAPLEAPYPADIQRAFDAIMPPGIAPLALFTTLARNPHVYAKFRAGSLLDKGSLTVREREIVIGRTTARCGSEYEWGLHITFFAAAAELTPAQIAAGAAGPADDPVWTPRERLLLRLVDQLHDRCDVEGDLWTALTGEFDDEQILELIALAGFYRTVSYFTNALRLPLEAYGARFPA